MKHKFGGDWTEIKLSLIKSYLNFYPVALQKFNFNLHYIDLFSGSGKCEITKDGKGQLLDGSAKIALETKSPFTSYHFSEVDIPRYHELVKLCSNYPHLNINCYNEDANQAVFNICDQLDPSKDRATMFVDPYAMNFGWKSLERVALSKVIDIWYLFPFMALFRQACNLKSKIDDSKRNAINNLLGTNEWENDWYHQTPQSDMFDEFPSEIRKPLDHMEKYIEQRFKTIFPFVNKPVVLKANGSPLFLLFFAISNDSPKAIGLAKKVSDDIITRQLTQAQASDSTLSHSKGDHSLF